MRKKNYNDIKSQKYFMLLLDLEISDSGQILYSKRR